MSNPAFHAVLAEMAALHDRKNADYGQDQDPLANFRGAERFGVPAWVGAMIRASDKVARIESFAAKGELRNEGVEDSLIDLANYAVLALVLYREGQPQPEREVVIRFEPDDGRAAAQHLADVGAAMAAIARTPVR